MSQKGLMIASRENPLKQIAEELRGRGMEVTVLYREDVNSAEKLQLAAAGMEAPDFLILSSLCDRGLEKKNYSELTPEEYYDWKYYALQQFYDISAAFVSKMVSHGGGKVLGILSEAGVIPTKNECMNGGAGAALVMGLQCMAEESHEDGIYTCAVAIGSMEEAEGFRATVNDPETVIHLPGKKLLSPDEVAARVVDLLEATGPVMTGNVITLDGGFSCAYMREW